MIIKGIPFLVYREGTTSKYLFYMTDLTLDNKVLDNRDSIKLAIEYLKYKVLYLETNKDIFYSQDEYYLIAEKTEFYKKNIYDDVIKDNSIILGTLLTILATYVCKIPETNDNSQINKNDFNFLTISNSSLVPVNKDDKIKDYLFSSKNKLYNTSDYIIEDSGVLPIGIIQKVIKFIGIDNYIKFIFNFITCIPKGKLRLFDSIVDYNNFIDNCVINDTFSDNKSLFYLSLDKEISILLDEENFIINSSNILSILIANPFIMCLVFENNQPILPLFFVENMYGKVIGELNDKLSDDDKNNYIKFLTKIYMIYAMKVLELGREIPDVDSVGNIIPNITSDDNFIAGSTLISSSVLINNIKNLLDFRKFNFKSLGGCSVFRTCFNQFKNNIVSINKSFKHNFNKSTNLDLIFNSVDETCYIDNKTNNCCLKSNYKLNLFLKDIIYKVVDKKVDTSFGYLSQNSDGYTKDQFSAVNNFIYNNVMILSGRPGSGKTYTICKIACSILNNDILSYGKSETLFLFLSFTNKAVSKLNDYLIKNINNQKLVLEKEENEENESIYKKNVQKTINNCKNFWVGTIDLFCWLLFNTQSNILKNKIDKFKKVILIFDECSMVSLDKFILSMVSLINNLTEDIAYKKLSKLIFTGDYAQLISIAVGDFFGDIMKVLPMIDLKETVRYGKDSKIDKFFDIIRNTRFEGKYRDIAKKYLNGIMPIEKNNKNAVVYPCDDVFLNDNNFYMPMDECIKYSYWFNFHITQNIAKDVLGINLTKETYMDKKNQAKSDDVLVSNKKEYLPYFMQVSSVINTNKILEQIFLDNSYKFKIITKYKKQKSVSGEYFISSSKRINKNILFSLLGIRFLEDKYVFEKNDSLNIFGAVPSKQYIDVDINNNIKMELNDVITKLIQKENYKKLKFFLSDLELNKLFFIRKAPYIVKSRRLRKYGLNIGDFLTCEGTLKKDKNNFIVFSRGEGDNTEYFELNINFIYLNDLDYGWAVNVHQLQGDEFKYVYVPFIGNLYLNPIKDSIVYSNNIKRFDIKAFYTAITRVNLMDEGRLVIYFGKQFLNIFDEIDVQLRNTPFKLLL